METETDASFENGRDKAKVYRYLLISFIYLLDCKLVFILFSVTKEDTSVSFQAQARCSLPSVLPATSQYSVSFAKNMSATSTIPKRETAQNFMVTAEATSAVSRVGQSSFFDVGQMQSFGDTSQTRTNDSMLDIFAQSDQCMPDAGGEATGQQTIPRTITSAEFSENMLFASTTDTLASLVGNLEASPFQSDGESVPNMQQVSTGNSLPDSFHEAGKEIKPLSLN